VPSASRGNGPDTVVFDIMDYLTVKSQRKQCPFTFSMIVSGEYVDESYTWLEIKDDILSVDSDSIDEEAVKLLATLDFNRQVSSSDLFKVRVECSVPTIIEPIKPVKYSVEKDFYGPGVDKSALAIMQHLENVSMTEICPIGFEL